ncbi:MAG: TerB N-terminal domain-containing protein, partial [Thaumarchaeota archaeon]|nr:TerB N-terminal domain-containing protein [Nitrososphaerota archaeon]
FSLAIAKHLAKPIMNINDLAVHEDIKPLLWISNGPMQNYGREVISKRQFEVNGIVFTMTFSGADEPSAINTSLGIFRTGDGIKVERPPYYPSYSGLTEEQRGEYWKLLSDPYDATIDIGYVFILYYGLERHLLVGNFEKAFDVILKLRDVHTNGSFQYYSGNALVLSSLYHQRVDMALKFFKSLDNEYELHFSDNLFLICAYSFDVPLKSKDIMRMARTFEFENKTYIHKYPQLFEQSMQEVICCKHGSAHINLKDIVTAAEFRKLRSEGVRIFGNVSLTDHQIMVPVFADSFKLKKSMYEILEDTHEKAKAKLAGLRRTGEIQPSAKDKPTNPVLVFDSGAEKELLSQLKRSSKDPVQRHFAFLALQEFYYRYRSLGDTYLNKCIDYCLADINGLDELENAHIQESIATARALSHLYSKAEMERRIQEIKKQGFYGSIPAFKRLAIIYEKKGQYRDAIEICEKAIGYEKNKNYDKGEFENRLAKLALKISKQ